MTVIAWDGKTLAADKQTSSAGTISTVTKLFRIRGHIVGGSGGMSDVLMHCDWFERGADPTNFPEHLHGGDGMCPSNLLVVTPDGKILSYEDGPFPIPIEDSFYAIGSGKDFALAAMHLGRTADEAVQVASTLSLGCGQGIDTMTLDAGLPA